ncbi:MAG: PadR family transcriptional regulator [Burkholderiales bacterium]
MAEKGYIILQLLSCKPDMYGLEMVECSRGQLKRGTVYVTLNRLEDKGYITSKREAVADDDATVIPRRLYKLTGLGARALAAHEAAAAVLRLA